MVTCPGCKLKMLWVTQPRRVVVRCPNRQITAWIGNPPRKQQGFVIYGTTDRKLCWYETYWVDGPDHVPTWRCGNVFAVKAA